MMSMCLSMEFVLSDQKMTGKNQLTSKEKINSAMGKAGEVDPKLLKLVAKPSQTNDGDTQGI